MMRLFSFIYTKFMCCNKATIAKKEKSALTVALLEVFLFQDLNACDDVVIGASINTSPEGDGDGGISSGNACIITEIKALKQTCKKQSQKSLLSGCAKRGLDHDIMYVVNTLTNQGKVLKTF